MSLRKNSLVVEAAVSAGVTNVVGGRLVDALLMAIVREVAGGSKVGLGRFGSFVCVDVPPKGGRGKTRREVRFTPGKIFRDAAHL